MAYQFPQGYVRHGQGKSRLVAADAFVHKLNTYIDLFAPILFGTITLDPNAIYQYGTLERIETDEAKASWRFRYRHLQTKERLENEVPLRTVRLTHDVEFVIEDETKGNVTYPVFYITANHKQTKKPVTYYMGAENIVSNPLDCIAEFYVRSHEFGTDLKPRKQASCRWQPPSSAK